VSSHVQSPSLIAVRSERIAGFLGAHRAPVADVLPGAEEYDEFVPVERRSSVASLSV
jgi:hypothetical protein